MSILAASIAAIPLIVRGGVAEECGRVGLFLAAPASSYVTGVILPVDGGS